MTKIIIYAGLSLSFSEAKEILNSDDNNEVIYKRPIQRGDLSLAVKENPDIIGIIDGVFHQNSAIHNVQLIVLILSVKQIIILNVFLFVI